ncbi:phosphotransferase [Saccharopolyspora gloriosae]|uniref:phosphotransferase n=1 Tax=Saccharopolyspora gloriosae TaxID=455344 RepID=UPI0037CA18F6
MQPDDPAETRRSLEIEAGAAHELRRHSRAPTLEPVAIGEPGAGYPLPWSVQTWLPGNRCRSRRPVRLDAVRARPRRVHRRRARHRHRRQRVPRLWPRRTAARSRRLDARSGVSCPASAEVWGRPRCPIRGAPGTERWCQRCSAGSAPARSAFLSTLPTGVVGREGSSTVSCGV